MKCSIARTQVRQVVFVLLSAFLWCVGSSARGEENIVDASQIQKFTDDELRDLVAPVALYPDALLAQVLPASTFPVDVAAAARYVQSSKDPSNPPSGVNWDSSVIALLHFPTVLKRMGDDISWTERLGMAVTYQMADITETIQQVRAEAQAAGNLVTNSSQVVSMDRNVITIMPADPNIIYVPTYEPDVIFVQHDSWEPYISFGIGFGSGLWLSNEFDWRYHRIGIYSDWYNGGWRRHNRSSYWAPSYRPIPSWYARGSVRSFGTASNYGYRSSRNFSNSRTTRVAPTQRTTRTAPAQPLVRTTPAPNRAVNPPVTHAEGLGRSGQQTRREANRGGTSRQNVQTARPAPAQAAPAQRTPQPARAPQRQNEMRPSNGQQTKSESSRGAASRGGNRDRK